ncbi:acyl-CoA thioesterase [Steroidobacter sp.]|uniref:acyl-CoA thioesterase n=1 Tax=Steroidobacter sp. TaxID=1978227 RepID=UPI001A4E9FC4|nr:thioesterase family protein [Steroidobacter sp.]MBL8265679.1 acyl-CoA thioesterase [Steroidobacter sp.]
MSSATATPRRQDFKVLRSMPTRWNDNDHYGHVNNVVYYSYFDSAVNGYLIEATGVDTRELPAIGLVAETGCRYLKELSFPDRLEIGLRLEKLGTSSVIYQLAVFRSGDDEPAAIGRFVHVYVDREHRRPVNIPDVVRTALAKL